LMDSRTSDLQGQADELSAAINNGEIKPNYQPKVVRSADGSWSISEVEALARWHREDGETEYPREFNQVAEDAGLLPKLTDSILQQVSSQLQEWESRGRSIAAAIDVAPSLLTDPLFAERLVSIMKEHALDNSRLTLEVEETVAMQDPGEFVEVLEELRALGFGLAISNFGTGHSSVEQLHRMPFNELKIDRFLVREMGAGNGSALIVEALVMIGHKLNMSVCAEGVESRKVLESLFTAGCDKLQGYYLGRPSSAEALEVRAQHFDQTGFAPDTKPDGVDDSETARILPILQI